MTVSDILLKSFSENPQKWTEMNKTNHFSIFYIFHKKMYDFELFSLQK